MRGASSRQPSWGGLARIEVAFLVAVWLVVATSLQNAPRTPPGHQPAGDDGQRLRCVKTGREFTRWRGLTKCPWCGQRLDS